IRVLPSAIWSSTPATYTSTPRMTRSFVGFKNGAASSNTTDPFMLLQAGPVGPVGRVARRRLWRSVRPSRNLMSFTPLRTARRSTVIGWVAAVGLVLVLVAWVLLRSVGAGVGWPEAALLGVV